LGVFAVATKSSGTRKHRVTRYVTKFVLCFT